MKYIVEAFYWFLIFLSPLVASLLLATVAFYLTHLFLVSFGVVILGITSGIYLAEWARIKYGCSNFLSRGNRVIEIVDEADDA